MLLSRRARRSLATLLPIVALLSYAPLAHAQSDEDRETAQVLFKQGNDLRTAGDVPGAAAKYKVAYALVQTPVIGLAYGKAELELGQLVEARQTFLSIGRIPVLPNESARATTARAEVVTLAAQLEPKIATVTLKLHASPGTPRPAVTIDAVALPDVALEAPRRLNPGDHVAVATVGGVKSETKFHLEPGETKDVGVEVPDAPASEDLAPGPALGAQASVVPSSPAAPPHSRVPAYIALGVGGAGVIVTAAFGALALGNKSTLNGDCTAGHSTCPGSAQSEINSFRTNAIVSDIGLGIGVVGVGIGGLLLLTNRGESSSPPTSGAVHVVPWLGLGSAGVRGSF